MKIFATALLLTMLAIAPASATPRLLARVDIASQTMNVYEDGFLAYSWPVSTAGRGYHTPVGSFRPTRLHPMWYSKKYDNSPMPHSIFFRGGYAIHGTYSVRSLGRQVSHGCVRLHPDNARTLYDLVLAYGSGDTSIVISNGHLSPPAQAEERSEDTGIIYSDRPSVIGTGWLRGDYDPDEDDED